MSLVRLPLLLVPIEGKHLFKFQSNILFLVINVTLLSIFNTFIWHISVQLQQIPPLLSINVNVISTVYNKPIISVSTKLYTIWPLSYFRQQQEEYSCSCLVKPETLTLQQD